jgi:hypothetical protein
VCLPQRLERVLAPCVGMQVVHEVAATHNQDSLLAQRRYALADLVVERRRLRPVDVEPHDRNARCGIHVAKNRPPSEELQEPNLASEHLSLKEVRI